MPLQQLRPLHISPALLVENKSISNRVTCSVGYRAFGLPRPNPSWRSIQDFDFDEKAPICSPFLLQQFYKSKVKIFSSHSTPDFWAAAMPARTACSAPAKVTAELGAIAMTSYFRHLMWCTTTFMLCLSHGQDHTPMAGIVVICLSSQCQEKHHLLQLYCLCICKLTTAIRLARIVDVL